MLIRCPQCGTGFNLPQSKIPGSGAKVKCSACTHTFRVKVENDAPVFFYKKGETPATGETMASKPVDLESLGQTAVPAPRDEKNEKTQFGIPARSKSAREGYNPFPLAGTLTGEQAAVTEEEARNDSTQLFGSASEAFDDDYDDHRDVVDENNARTKLGPQGLAEESGDRTSIGAPISSAAPPPLRTTEDEEGEQEDDVHNNATQAFGSGGLDLFDGELPERPSEPPPIEIDPFGDAFDEPMGDVGLLMPSTPITDDPVLSNGLGLESSSEVSPMSEEQFLLGGGRSDFGDALSLVDNSFGDEGASFDADQGVVADEKPRPTRRSTTGKQRSLKSDVPLELEDVRTDERPRERTKARRPTPEPASPDRVERERPSRPSPAYVHQVGATSAARRTFDLIFIGLVVCAGFVALIASRAGGFVDFSRFGHMVEVAFTDVEFEPREEWTKIVEVEPPEPPPDEPLRLQNVRAVEKQIDDQRVLVVSGRIRNYSLVAFKGVKIKAVVKDGDKIVAERVHTVGQTIDRKKFGAAKSVEAVKASLVGRLPDIGKEGRTHFAIVFDDVPSELVASGKYDYAVTVAD